MFIFNIYSLHSSYSIIPKQVTHMNPDKNRTCAILRLVDFWCPSCLFRPALWVYCYQIFVTSTSYLFPWHHFTILGHFNIPVCLRGVLEDRIELGTPSNALGSIVLVVLNLEECFQVVLLILRVRADDIFYPVNDITVAIFGLTYHTFLHKCIGRRVIFFQIIACVQ